MSRFLREEHFQNVPLIFLGLFHVSRDFFKIIPYAFVYGKVGYFVQRSFVPVDYYQFCSAVFCLTGEVVGGRDDKR